MQGEKGFYKRETCRLCDSLQLNNILTLTPTPPGNHFVKKEQVGMKQTCYPLTLNFCSTCHHVQLGYVVDPKILYQQNYTYVSATSPVFVKHLKDYCENILKRFPLANDGLVIGIGSNDGTALNFFKSAGHPVLGIDPAREIVQAANRNGIETLCEFFNINTAKKHIPLYGKAKLINSHNACAHIDDLASVIHGVKHWLDDDGLFVMEVGYLVDIYENAWFDTIYHEHVDYHTVAPLIRFFDRFDMEIIDVERIAPQGGSIRVITQHKGGPHSKNQEAIQSLVQLEKSMGLDTIESFHAFAAHIDKVKQKLAQIIKTLKAQGASISGFGAPTKATTLLAHFDLAWALDYLVDDNPLKQNVFSPGFHLPVYSAQILKENKPDYLLILAWNFAPSIMQKHQDFLKAGGHFILPMPEPKIIKAETYDEEYSGHCTTS